MCSHKFFQAPFLSLRVRPRAVPWAWVLVGASQKNCTWVEQKKWALIFSAQGIPYQWIKKGQKSVFYVPALWEKIALTELQAFSEEEQRVQKRVLKHTYDRHDPVTPVGNWVVLLFLYLLIWHGVKAGWWSQFDFFPPDTWVTHGALDVVRMKVYDEWYRSVTALTLHADNTHLLSNLTYGSIFAIILCRHFGLGFGLLLIVCGGALGNILSALYRQGAWLSMGFSTAIFASVGALAGAYVVKNHLAKGRVFVPLAAAGALLALLGTEGERSDYVAHVCGLLGGILCGILAQIVKDFCFSLEGSPEKFQKSTMLKCKVNFFSLLQWISGVLAVLILLFAWKFAGI